MSEPNTAPASAASVMTGIIDLIEGAMSTTESEKTRTRLRLVSVILDGIADEATSLLADKFDINAIMTGLQRVEIGLADVEGGIKDVHDAVKKPVQASQNGPAA